MKSIIEGRQSQNGVHVILVLFCFLVLFFPSHILWTLTIILCIVHASFVFFVRRKLGHPISFPFLFIGFYVLMAISFFWAEDAGLALKSLQMKLIVLTSPLCFLIWNPWTERQFYFFTKVLGFAVFLSFIYVVVNFVTNKSEILETILRGHPIPVPFKDHIRYAILLCFLLISSIFHADLFRKNGNTKKFQLCFILCISLFLYILFLAVKTGILLAIVIVISFILYKMLDKRLYLKGAIAILSLMGIVYFSIQSIPTVRNKISYFAWDIMKYKERDFKNYSDGERIESIIIGFRIASERPWLGLGEGNLVSKIPSKLKKMPHNQFLVVWAQNGILGLGVFSSIFVVSLIIGLRKQSWIIVCTTLILSIANILEPMLETQLGITLFALPFLIVHSISYRPRS